MVEAHGWKPYLETGCGNMKVILNATDLPGAARLGYKYKYNPDTLLCEAPSQFPQALEKGTKKVL